MDADIKEKTPIVGTTSDKKNEIKIAVNNLSAFFGKNQALREVSLDVKANRVLAIIGPSGCGKSTFLRSINRMHEVAGGTITGEIIFDNEDVMKVDPVYLRRKIGMVFQKPNPFPTMSIYNNVVVGLKLNGIRSKKILDEVVERSLKRVALWDEVKDILNKSGAHISGGQQQRLCIARTLAVEPEVILMDEPTSALDPISTSKIEELMFELKNDYTIVIVTHNMQQASRISDRTAFFYLGQLVEEGTTKDIFINPKHERTENYITGRFG